jgi:RecA/RadA recombinase
VSRVPPTGAARVRKIDALLADLGSQLQRGGGAREHSTRPTYKSGVAEIDQLIGGGFPLGSLSEISGASSSGRTSLALSLLAETTRAGELVGLVDEADAFDPVSAERAGVCLNRVLWVRAQSSREALRCSERLIQTEGFPLVLLDWTARPHERAREREHAREREKEPIHAAAWLRLTRMAASSRTAVLLLSTKRLAGPHAAIALEMQVANARFTGTPALLEELETRAVLVRHKTSPIDQAVSFTPHSSRRVSRESAA